MARSRGMIHGAYAPMDGLFAQIYVCECAFLSQWKRRCAWRFDIFPTRQLRHISIECMAQLFFKMRLPNYIESNSHVYTGIGTRNSQNYREPTQAYTHTYTVYLSRKIQ